MKEKTTIKIVQIIPELNLKIMGGIGRFVQTLLYFIDKEKTKNIIVTYKSDPEDRAYYENLGIPVFSLLENTQLPEQTAIATTKWLIKTLKNIQPDIVINNGFWGTTLGVKASYTAGVPIIITIDDNIDLDETPQQKRVKKHLADFTDCIICVSSAVKNYAYTVEQIPETKLKVIYNGIRLEEYPFRQDHSQPHNPPLTSDGSGNDSPQPPLIKKMFEKSSKPILIPPSPPSKGGNLRKIGKEVPLIKRDLGRSKTSQTTSKGITQTKVGEFVFVARLEPQKVPERAINAIAKLQEKGYDCSLSIIGDGSLKAECEERVKQLKLTEKIKFLGYQEKPWQLTSPDSIFVMTSDFEGQPNTVLEAMATGCLCILPTIEPTLEIARDGKEALFYEAGNQEKLEENMELALRLSPEEKFAIIHQARARVEQQFDAKIMAQNYLNLYQEFFWRKQGDNLVQQGALNQAISAYRKVLRFNPNSGYSFQSLAEIMGHKEWKTEAIRFYTQAWLSNPQEVKTWHNEYQKNFKIKSPENTNKKSIFILGSGHSGTTLMLRLLGDYPLIYAISYESQIFTKSAIKIKEQLQEWDNICFQNNKQHWVEKTPQHIYTLGKIFAHRPNSKIIWMMRDFRDVICSQIKVPMIKHFGFEKLLNQCIASIVAGMNFLDDSRIKLVKYEDIVTQTEETLQYIFLFLEEDYQEKILYHREKTFYFMNNPKITKPENVEDKQYISQLRNWQVNQPIFDGRGRWKKEMSEEQKEIFKQKAQKYLVHFGYATDDQW